MLRETVRWVKYLAPGSFVAEEWEKDIAVGTKPRDVKWPDSAYAFTVHERDDIVDDGKRYKGETRQVGPVYYHPDSKVETLAEVRVNPNATRVLVENMECNKWDAIVWSRWGNWPQPWDATKAAILGPDHKDGSA